jgi:hypothetical protein
MLSPSFAHAQNLVPNPSFEQYKKLNCVWGNAYVLNTGLDPVKTFDSLLYDWVEVSYDGGWLFSTLVDPNCYKTSNICTSVYCTSNPISIGGVLPKDGNNFCSILLLEGYKNRANGRGYIQTALTDELKAGSHYLAGLYSMLPPKNYTGDYACNNFGMFFHPMLLVCTA